MEESKWCKRVGDAFAHVGMAVALRHSSQVIADIYGVQVNLQLPLPPYPGAIYVPQRRLVLA